MQQILSASVSLDALRRYSLMTCLRRHHCDLATQDYIQFYVRRVSSRRSAYFSVMIKSL